MVLIVGIAGCAAPNRPTDFRTCPLQLVAEHTDVPIEDLVTGVEILCDRPGDRCVLVYQQGRFNSWEVAVRGPGCRGQVSLVPE